MIPIAAIIFVLEGRPVFYQSYRAIDREKCISIYKFRTMVKDARSPKHRLEERFMRDGYLDIPLSCEVYTPIGRILERTQLVETPQLFNILFNKISFVGNRPLPTQNIEILKRQFKNWHMRFDSPAGLTGISQIAGKYDLTAEKRLLLEGMYSNLYNNPKGNILICDLLIIWHTIKVILFGAYINFDAAKSLLIKCGAEDITSNVVMKSP